MKTKKLLIMIVIVFMTGLVACGNKHEESIDKGTIETELKDVGEGQNGSEVPMTHVHTYADGWKLNGDSHWKECVCGKRENEKEHSYGEWEIIQEATEDVAGIKKRICDVCKYEEKQSLAIIKHSHEFSTDWKIDDGSHWYECACGEKKEISAHSYEDWVITKEATKTSTGSQYHICKDCNYKEEMIIPDLSHKHNFSSEWKSNSATHWNECSCTEKREVASHTYSNWVTLTEATCTKTGVKEHSCTVCGYKETAVIGKIAHNETIDNAINATCTMSGKTQGKHCSVCNTVLLAQQVIPAKGHGTIKYTYKEPTCTEDGESEGAYCQDCGMVTIVGEKVPALGHIEKIIPAVDVTCTKDGKTEGKGCSRCGTVLVKQQIIKSLGHIEKIISAVDATCTERGKTEGKGCSRCGMVLVKQQIIEALGHKRGIRETAPTCTEEGYRCEYCSECNVVFKEEILAATGHTIEIIPGVEATCIKAGKTEGKRCANALCSNINHIIEPCEKYYAEHNYVNGVCTMCQEIEGQIPDFSNKDYSEEVMVKFVVDAIITDDMSEFEKAITIHDWLTYNVDYDYANYKAGTIPNTSRSVRGVLKTHKAVCQGYSGTFERLAEAAGLETICIIGGVSSGQHEWNQVKVNGGWYNVDVTWDDPVWSNKDPNDHSSNSYDYFLISTEKIEKTHSLVYASDDSELCDVKNCPETYDRDAIENYVKNKEN